MQSKWKKALGLIMAATCLSTAFAGCGEGSFEYKGDVLDGYVASAPVSSNGGFAVVKGDYVYFINGQETHTANNEYGEVVKGALMRISKTDLENGVYDNVKTVVPSLFVAQDYSSGIYIYGDYVYYATPTTDKNEYGEIANDQIDFKRAKLDGTEGPMRSCFARVANTTRYRFVQGENGTVYCVYEDGTSLKSVVASGEKAGTTTTLVKGASSKYQFDATNPENPNVYYAMGVKDDETGTGQSYDQIYCVNAAATAKVEEDGVYSVYDETGAKMKTYSFDVEDMEEANETASAAKQDEPHDFDDYSTYPYVNLGKLVLDGVGCGAYIPETQYNWDENRDDAGEYDGYKYSLGDKCYIDGDLYFTRSRAGMNTDSDTTDAKLYCLTAEDAAVADWNTITGNDGLRLVAHDTTNAKVGESLFYRDGAKQYYIYKTSDNNNQKHLWRSGYDNDAGAQIPAVRIQKNAGDVTLWKIDEETETLYYFGTGENGNNLVKVNYNGDVDDYNTNTNKGTVYEATTLNIIDWNSSWYNPEIIGDTVLFSNAQTFGNAAYNYIYAATLGEVADAKAANEQRTEIKNKITEYANYEKLQNAMNYYYRTGETTLFEAVREEYSASEQEHFDAFVAMFAEDGEFVGGLETAHVHLVGKKTEADEESMTEAWKEKLYVPEAAEEEKEPFPVWAIVLIAGGAALVAISATVLISAKVKAKRKAKAEAEATVNAAKRKRINTEDDKTIDVYAEDPVEESVEEETPATEENVGEEPTEAPVETEETVAPTAEENQAE